MSQTKSKSVTFSIQAKIESPSAYDLFVRHLENEQPQGLTMSNGLEHWRQQLWSRLQSQRPNVYAEYVAEAELLRQQQQNFGVPSSHSNGHAGHVGRVKPVLKAGNISSSASSSKHQTDTDAAAEAALAELLKSRGELNTIANQPTKVSAQIRPSASMIKQSTSGAVTLEANTSTIPMQTKRGRKVVTAPSQVDVKLSDISAQGSGPTGSINQSSVSSIHSISPALTSSSSRSAIGATSSNISSSSSTTTADQPAMSKTDFILMLCNNAHDFDLDPVSNTNFVLLRRKKA